MTDRLPLRDSDGSLRLRSWGAWELLASGDGGGLALQHPRYGHIHEQRWGESDWLKQVGRDMSNDVDDLAVALEWCRALKSRDLIALRRAAALLGDGHNDVDGEVE